MTNLVEVKVTENNKGIAVFNVDLGLTLTDVTIEYDVTLTESGSIIAMGLNRMTIKNQKGEFNFVSDGNHSFKGVGRGRKPNSIIDIAVTSLDVVETEMILGSFDTEIFLALSQTEIIEKVTSDTETVNTTETETEEEKVIEEVTISSRKEETQQTKRDTPSNTDQNCSPNERIIETQYYNLDEKILNNNTLDESVETLYNALVESRNDDLMENVFSLTELKFMFECQGMSQEEISQTLDSLSNSNTSYFIDVEGCNFRPVTEADLLDIIQKLHSNSQQKIHSERK